MALDIVLAGSHVIALIGVSFCLNSGLAKLWVFFLVCFRGRDLAQRDEAS